MEVPFDAAKPPPPPSRIAPKPVKTLRFSVAAMQSPRGTYVAYTRLLERIGFRLGMEIQLVQRRSYREVSDLLIAGQTDVAFVCTGGFFDLLRRASGSVEVIAAPVVGGTMTYQSLIIVPANGTAQRFEDLAGKKFAFTDELSFTGHAYPTYLVRSAGLAPERFFSAALFTRSHDRSVHAVAKSLVDGAAVDSHIFEGLVAAHPELAQQVRVIRRSPPFGIPPVVALTSLPAETRARIRGALLALDGDREATLILRELGIERFAVPPRDWYDAAAVVVEGGR
jgi:phosphonate transport system substrate-binding protein